MMKKNNNDPKPGAQKVTNQDEQDVAVNQSTTQQGGYDEPINESSPPRVEKSDEKKDKSKTQQQERPANNK